MRGFKIAHRRLGRQLRTARDRVAQLSAQRQNLPKRVEVRDLTAPAMVKLATERKHLTPRCVCENETWKLAATTFTARPVYPR